MEPLVYILLGAIGALIAYCYLQYKSICGWEARCADQRSTIETLRNDAESKRKDFTELQLSFGNKCAGYAKILESDSEKIAKLENQVKEVARLGVEATNRAAQRYGNQVRDLQADLNSTKEQLEMAKEAITGFEEQISNLAGNAYELESKLATYQFPEITTKPHWDEQDEAAAAAFFRGPVGGRLLQSLEFEAHAINAKTVQQRDNVERHCGAACGWASAVAYIKQNSGCHRPSNGETDSDGTKPEIPTAELYRA